MKIICSERERVDMLTACVNTVESRMCEYCPLGQWCREELRSIFAGLDGMLESEGEAAENMGGNKR